MAKVKIRWKKIAAFVAEISEALAPLVPIRARVKFTGASAIDKEGGFNVGGRADIADVMTLAGGVPVGIEGALTSEHDNQGKSDLEIEIEFGPPPTST